MFKKKKLEVRVVNEEPREETVWQEHIDPKDVARVVQDSVDRVVSGVVVIMVAGFVLRTAEHLIVNAVKASA